MTGLWLTPVIRLIQSGIHCEGPHPETLRSPARYEGQKCSKVAVLILQSYVANRCNRTCSMMPSKVVRGVELSSEWTTSHH